MKQLTITALLLICLSSNAVLAQENTQPPMLVTFTVSAQVIKLGNAEHKKEWPKIPPQTQPGLPIQINLSFLKDSSASMDVKSLSPQAAMKCKCAGTLVMNGKPPVKLTSSATTSQVQQAQTTNMAAYRTVEFKSASGTIYKTATNAQGNFVYPSGMTAGSYMITVAGMFSILDYPF